MAERAPGGEGGASRPPRALDAVIVAGVAAKLRAMLAQDGHLVEVPLSPIAYTAHGLRFSGDTDGGMDGGMDVERSATLAEFSVLANGVMSGSRWGWPGQTPLWEVCRWVQGAELAVDDLPEPERRRYEEARALLFEDASGGGPLAYSRIYEDYLSAAQAYRAAQAHYDQLRHTAELSHDPEERRRWEREEPELAAACRAARHAWESLGRKDEVERALDTKDRLGARLPARVWAEFRRSFDPRRADHWRTSPNGERYVPTYYRPATALDGTWRRVRLPRDVLVELAERDGGRTLPRDLPTGLDSSVTAVTFDYCVVQVVRPWFESPMDLFGSRAWRFAGAEPPLSDGADPPEGRCTGYVERIVLARDVRVIRRVIEALSAGAALPAPTHLGPLEPVTAADVRHRLRLPDAAFTAAMDEPAPQDPDIDLNVISAGAATLGYQAAFSFDLGTACDAGDADVRWDQSDPWKWRLARCGTAGLRLLGPGDFDALGAMHLHGLHYGEDYLPAGPSGGNRLTPGTCFAVRTRAGHHAKAQVTDFDSDLSIRWVTYGPVDITSSDPRVVYLLAADCRLLPRSPDPDPTFEWPAADAAPDEAREPVDDRRRPSPLGLR
ncbi:unnamed protein product [[Actinomadura] parvosata subsp. kistnae]|uniref:Uncharacterized protein n=1 Tax=[Actinomadura] parvosata subsp. kistnae TaxID=1909395 RepID=A0A1U9ZY29_9ACTN|nr:hypothetical protein [Nonomuraea sp. ATCC 55076]AQZ62840.1 hypothetical protein BKM31_16490 [Nonomuraea sp. ATCC 55076]SPL98381.1 unnamed protein product [Actinomadura parvosata subsp. kistnae]